MQPLFDIFTPYVSLLLLIFSFCILFFIYSHIDCSFVLLFEEGSSKVGYEKKINLFIYELPLFFIIFFSRCIEVLIETQLRTRRKMLKDISVLEEATSTAEEKLDSLINQVSIPGKGFCLLKENYPLYFLKEDDFTVRTY